MKNFITNSFLSLLFFIILISTISCNKRTHQAIDTKDLSYLYNPTKNIINPRYSFINKSDELTVLSVKFFANELFFSEANPQGVPTASMQIIIKVFNISQGKVLVDTANYNISIIKEGGRPEYLYNLPLEVEKGFEYVAEIRIIDKLRLISIQAFESFNTLSYNNKYNFRLQGHFSKNELFYPVLKVHEYVNLLYQRAPLDSLFILFYKPFKEVPDPPSMLLPEKTLDYDPSQVVAIPYSDTLPMMLPREGIYFYSVGRSIKEGYTLYNMGASFPNMETPEDMIEPVIYLSSKDEVAAMRSAAKPKLALDEFWIKCGGNIEKARELIRIYYTRVLYSNYYFTSYKEGWRSERGMIYIIYGPPDKVYKTFDGENWGYKKLVVKSSWGGRYTVTDEYLFFNFKKRACQFSDNDYYLSRIENPVTYWDQAILSWKKGIVFRLDNPEDI